MFLCKTGSSFLSATLLVALRLLLSTLLLLKKCCIPSVRVQCVTQFFQCLGVFVIIQGVVSSKLPCNRTILVLVGAFEGNQCHELVEGLNFHILLSNCGGIGGISWRILLILSQQFNIVVKESGTTVLLEVKLSLTCLNLTIYSGSVSLSCCRIVTNL